MKTQIRPISATNKNAQRAYAGILSFPMSLFKIMSDRNTKY